MSAAVLDVAPVGRGPSKFFQALAEVDQRIAERERLEWVASFAPPVRAGGWCPCGSVFEARSSQIELTAEETSAASEAVADLFGRAVLDELDPAVVPAVVEAINRRRSDDDHAALLDWQDSHAYCEDRS